MAKTESSAGTRATFSEDKCPRCGKDLLCLGGRSAHHSNWYCSDEKGCGWEAWNGKTAAERKS